MVEAEVLRLLAAGDQQREVRAGQGLGAAEHDADGEAHQQERHDLLLGQQQRHGDDHHPDRQADQDDRLGAVPPGGAAEEQRAEERHELHQQDRRDQHRLAEAELLGAVRRRRTRSRSGCRR